MLEESLNKGKTAVLKGVNILFAQKSEKYYSYAVNNIMLIFMLKYLFIKK